MEKRPISPAGLVLAALLGCLAPATAAEAGKPIIVVFSIEAKGLKLKARTLSTLSDYLATRLAATGAFQVVPREEIRRRLLTQKKVSYQACYDSACQIELGRELAAQKSLSTQLQRIGKTCVLTANLYDLKRAATEQGATAEGGCSEEALMAAVKDLAAQLGKGEAPPPAKAPAATAGALPFPPGFDPKRFDALGFLPRATELARAQMGDAELIDFDTEGVYPDGHVDLTLSPEFRASYAFRSEQNSRGDPSLPRNIEQEIRCLVHVEVSARSLEVFTTTSQNGCQEKPRPRWRCSLQQAWALARKDGAPREDLVAKVSWLWDGWYLDFGESSQSVPDACAPRK
jgi:hypothetical protein